MKHFFKTLFASFLLCTSLAIHAQDNTAALIPMPNHIEKSKNGATLQFDNKTVIRCSLPSNSFIIQELQRIVGRHLQLTPCIDNNIMDMMKSGVSIRVPFEITERR